MSPRASVEASVLPSEHKAFIVQKFTHIASGIDGTSFCFALGAIVGVAGVGAMYALHRMRHHWIERALPAAILVLGVRNTYLNSKLD